MLKIDLVRSRRQADEVGVLAYEFIDWLRLRYPEMNGEIDDYLTHQKFDEQISDVRKNYNPPQGECLLASHDGAPVGILMLKDLGQGVCEMNRMFVRQSGRGLGVGRGLIETLMQRARQMGFDTMVLSALPRHHEALALYRSIGFVDDEQATKAGDTSNAVPLKLEL